MMHPGLAECSTSSLMDGEGNGGSQIEGNGRNAAGTVGMFRY
jgi:hypothetical protein